MAIKEQLKRSSNLLTTIFSSLSQCSYSQCEWSACVVSPNSLTQNESDMQMLTARDQATQSDGICSCSSSSSSFCICIWLCICICICTCICSSLCNRSVCICICFGSFCVELFNSSCLHFELAPNICTTFCDRLTNFSFSFGLGLADLSRANQRIT